ncbi:hypothetical protein [Cryptosporangium minutisporangium]|uniref:Tetratricopeptide repeat protein n=1 Tax=Cryptosporangium minutisporangium TaxID=113569 RepID=A0ABP6SYS7_9ACTN
MNPTPHDLRHLLGTAWQMPYGRAQVAAVEEVIRHADAQQLADLQYAARILAIKAYNYAGEKAKVFVPFAWCLSVYDRGDADPHYDHSLMWAFKYVVSGLSGFPEVPLDRTRAVLDDMERRYRLAGQSLNPVYMLRTELADHLGDEADAAEQYRLWCAAPRGEFSDCIGCEPTQKARHLMVAGRYEDAMTVAAPVLSGSQTCVEQPAAILTALLEPFVRTGRHTEAADAHRRAYRQLQTSRSDLALIGEHVAFCARTGNLPRAVELIQRHVGWLDDPATPMADLVFSASAADALRKTASAGYDELVIRWGGEEHSAAVLGEELAARALALAARFDARNGTPAVGIRTRERLAAEPLADTLPLSGVARRRAASSGDPAGGTVGSAADGPTPELPATPEGLADWADLQGYLDNDVAIAAAWARFDELCPEPTGVLRGRRLIAAGIERAQVGDVAAADRFWSEAADVFAGHDDVRAAAARQRRGLLLCLTDRADEGLPAVEIEAALVDTEGSAGQRCASALRLSQARWIVGRREEAVEAARRALAIADSASDADAPARRADAEQLLAQLLTEFGPAHYAEAAEHADRAIALFTPLAPAEALHDAQLLAGRLRAVGGELEDAYALLGEAARLTDPVERAEALGLRGRVAFQLERPADAAAAFADAVTALDAAAIPRAAGHVRVDLARACLAGERPDEAVDALEEAIGALTADEDADTLLDAKSLLADCYIDLRYHEQALLLLDETAEEYAVRGEHGALGRARGVAADVLDSLDRDEAAAIRYEQAADAFAEIDDVLRHLHNRRGAGLSWHWAGRPERSLAALEAAAKLGDTIAEETPAKTWELGMMHYDTARVLARLNRLDDAVTHAATSAELFVALDATLQVTAAHTLHGRLLAELGRTAEARTALSAALELLSDEDHGLRAEIGELLQQLDE